MKLVKYTVVAICSLATLAAKPVATPEPDINAQELYNDIVSFYQNSEWRNVITASYYIPKKDKDDFPFAAEVCYFAGVAHFHLDNLEKSNKFFTDFLENYGLPKYFEEAVEFKFHIAEEYEKRAKNAFMVSSKWERAHELYDEVINLLPRHEIAAQSLEHKGNLFLQEKRFDKSIDMFETLLRRFPRHGLAPASYLAIAKVYLTESREEYPEMDYLEQAKNNLKKFHRDFPEHESLKEAEYLYKEMINVYAKDMYESGKFFEKRKKIPSAILYYQSVLQKYPESDYVPLICDKLEKWKNKHSIIDNDLLHAARSQTLAQSS